MGPSIGPLVPLGNAQRTVYSHRVLRTPTGVPADELHMPEIQLLNGSINRTGCTTRECRMAIVFTHGTALAHRSPLGCAGHKGASALERRGQSGWKNRLPLAYILYLYRQLAEPDLDFNLASCGCACKLKAPEVTNQASHSLANDMYTFVIECRCLASLVLGLRTAF